MGDEKKAYDPIVVNVVGSLSNRINQLCQELEEGSLDPEAKLLINKVVELQTELFLLKMEGADPEETDLIEDALGSAVQSLKAAVSVNVLSSVKRAWRSFIFDMMATVLKIVF